MAGPLWELGDNDPHTACLELLASRVAQFIKQWKQPGVRWQITKRHGPQDYTPRVPLGALKSLAPRLSLREGRFYSSLQHFERKFQVCGRWIPTIGHSGLSKTMKTVKRSVAAKFWRERGMHRWNTEFLGQWNSSVRSCHGRYMTLYICPNP